MSVPDFCNRVMGLGKEAGKSLEEDFTSFPEMWWFRQIMSKLKHCVMPLDGMLKSPI